MWQCPKCGMEVEDSLELCWICGTSADGTEYPCLPTVRHASEVSEEPLDVIEIIQAIGEAREKPRLPSVAGVPRRFSLGRLMLITAFFALLFGLLNWLDAHPLVFVVVTVFITVVGLAQAILYSGKRPRRASVVAGSAVCVLMGTILSVVDLFALFAARGGPGIGGLVCVLPLLVAVWAGAGAVLGYLAGCLIAGVFLGERSNLPEAEDRGFEAPDPLRPDGPEIASSDDLPEQ